ncbi:transmembrane protein 272 [Gasterosteus aculeatus]|uniref:Si:dkey-19b23.12 n=1 Tax=Gasterosteus aculeatus aculeatus TaxID=481459 RepID=A0AAQ4NY48_GASAC|nr:transmembrane protein 272-like [Gasterosteus aculeatus aculeatus]XP_040039095.1 transmembrane protein 272-like [Gasterosteus aculeatus aculeatus]
MSSSGLLRRIPRTPRPSTPVLVCSKLAVCVFPVAQIAIGAVHLEDCPLQRYIPIYLIVVGVFGLALAVLSCLPCTKSPEDDPEGGAPSTPLSLVCAAWNSLTSLFLFCWFIAGNVWIYSIYEPNYIKNSTSAEPYCDKTLYLFAFWTTTLLYIFLGLFLVCGFCVLFCFCLCGRADPDDDVPGPANRRGGV